MSRLSSVTTIKVTPNSARGFVFHTVSPSSKTKENNKQVMTYYFEFLQLSFGGDLDLRHSQHSVQSPEFSVSTPLFYSNYMQCIVGCALMLFNPSIILYSIVSKMNTTLFVWEFLFSFLQKVQHSVSLSEPPNAKRPRLDRTFSEIATGSLFAAMPV